jgi:hypothetical protein
MPPRLRKATLHGALFKLVKTRLCREWVRNLFGRRSGKLPRFYAWGRRIQPSSLALSLATPHARSRNSTGVIGASSSSPMLCEALIPGPPASLRNVTSYFVPGKLITIAPYKAFSTSPSNGSRVWTIQAHDSALYLIGLPPNA